MTIQYLITNGIFGICTVLGIFYNIGFCLVIAEVIAWLTILASGLIFIKPIKNEMIKSTKHFSNEFIDNCFDLCIVSIFWTNGYIFLPGFYFAHMFALKHLKEEWKLYWKNVPIDPKDLTKSMKIPEKYFKDIGPKDKK